MIFRDRADAAEQLAKRLRGYADRSDTIILAVPRGGVVLGAVLAERLHLKLDVILVKKIGHPSQPEFAIGAVSGKGVAVDEELLERGEVSKEYVASETARLRNLLRRRSAAFYGKRKPLPLRNKLVIITDDGIATGRTLLATIRIVRQQKPKRIVLAVPVAAPQAAEMLAREADETVFLMTPAAFDGISRFYGRFEQVEDEEAIRLFREARRTAGH